MSIQQERVKQRNTVVHREGAVIYWMSRDMRLQDNWALLYAQELALKHKQPLVVVYNLFTDYLGGIGRHGAFKKDALEQLEVDAKKKNIPFFTFVDDAHNKALYTFFKKEASAVVIDFNPLRIQQQWLEDITNQQEFPVYEVDAHNIIPAWAISDKQEYAAYTIRPKVHKALPKFLIEFPNLKKHPYDYQGQKPRTHTIRVPKDDYYQGKWKAGEIAAAKRLNTFLENIEGYAQDRNDPNSNALSDLSPYLHYGMISPQRVALEAQKYDKDIKAQEAFLEEHIVRRELSDNYCYYNKNYDNFNGFPDWAKETLNEHKKDAREYKYSKEEFEHAKIHDDLWNAAQMEMLNTGKMHGYMRMYWAKKILEWTSSPQEAQEIAIYLNDRYEMDGRDPNGYVGVAWSIGGVHDRAWTERPVFGKVRFMNYNGCKRKFDVDAYIAAHSNQQTLL